MMLMKNKKNCVCVSLICFYTLYKTLFIHYYVPTIIVKVAQIYIFNWNGLLNINYVYLKNVTMQNIQNINHYAYEKSPQCIQT